LQEIQEFSVDVMDAQIYSEIIIPQNDSGTSIRMTITKYGEPYSVSPMGAMLTMRKPDGHTIINNCVVNGNVVTATTTSQMTIIAGTIPFQVVLFSGSKVLSTINGELTITPSLTSDITVESTDEYTILQQITHYATLARSYTEGDTGTRTGEATDNTKYYYELSRNTTTGLVPKGTVTFAQLLALSSPAVNDMYNVSDSFTSTAAFKDGTGYTYPAGSNVYYTNDYKWDVLSGRTVAGVKGSAENSYRNGNVEITSANIGLPYAVNVKVSSSVPSGDCDIWMRKFTPPAIIDVDDDDDDDFEWE